MARSSAWLSLSLTFLVLFNGCFARQSFQQSPNECQLHQINAFEPTLRIQAEGGVTEFWDPYNEQFQCSGSHVFRHIIQPRSLLLPSYTNAPLVAYVQQGSGEFGIVVPGCAETYQYSQQSQQSEQERHQKIGSYRQGDILVFTEGTAHWRFEGHANCKMSSPSPPMCQLQSLPSPLYIPRFPLATSHHHIHLHFNYIPLTFQQKMARSSAWLSLSLTFLVLFNGCFARQSFQQSPNECQLHQINAFEPTLRIQAEGGVTEFWDPYNEQFQCSGSHVFRHIIQPRSLLLPSYTNAPLVAYVQQGSGEFGIVVPGCAETYQYSQQSQQSEQERHQKIGSYRQGDILVFTEGTAHWVYNSGEEQTVMVVLQDTSNDANQLDANPLRFFLAGNSEQSQGNSHQGQREQGRHQQGQREQEQREQGRQQGQQQHGGQQEQTRRLKEQLGYNSNLLSGFDVQIIKDALNTDMETAQKIVGENSQQERGHIITVERELQLIAPWYSQSEERKSGRQGGSSNGLEETLCTARVRQNIDNPERADIYDPQAGRFTALNRFTLPIFGLVRLSASRGVLNRNWGIVPKWTMNAHSFVYVTKGSAQVQIVNHQGETILDQQVQEGQLFLVPQNFAVVKQAGDQGFEWVEFNTNENAMYNTLSGRTSTLAGLPADIIAASYDLSSSKAQSLKQNMVSTWFYQASKGSRFV
ncbi:11S globulin seed storage protein Jug r 4-like [Ipomoea triloba]|uniref:11S globulin seed storage protein Jug r 4-like n=1 Tax=Ipomoea triloba TaxID=35885 RepID=UPI00125DB90D|nr:11S globulin seed storage protein Jug r 4-like [Ipomoea triloba]